MTVRDDTIPKERATVDADGRPAKMGRRAFLRGGARAMPAILTLQSGAALARSSNLISAAPAGTTDALGNTLCLDTTLLRQVGEIEEVYDLGEPATGTINVIPERVYNLEANNGSPQIDEGAICQYGGGPYWWKPTEGSWQQLTVNKGIVVSSAAASSFATGIMYNFL